MKTAALRTMPTSAAFLDQDARRTFPDSGISLEHRPAAAPPTGYDELVRKLIDGESVDAIAELRSLAENAPTLGAESHAMPMAMYASRELTEETTETEP